MRTAIPIMIALQQLQWLDQTLSKQPWYTTFKGYLQTYTKRIMTAATRLISTQKPLAVNKILEEKK